ncbi:MAG TPA: RDD family protein [Gammaproteobacteria bacterium]|nr:RDD family protein [Gammaproteobacteria bacterium]
MENVRPWVRFWARLLDISIYSTILTFIFPDLANFTVIWGENVPPQWMNLLHQLAAWGLVSLAAYIIFEGILLSTMGTTIGKWVFKISIKDTQGKKLSFRVALERTFLVYFRGFALLIPFVSIITLIYAYAALNSSGSTSWDKECHTVVTHQRIGFVHILIAILLFFVMANLKNTAMGMNMMTMTFKDRVKYACGIRG